MTPTDSLQTVVKQTTETPAQSHDIWMYLAFAEFLLLLVLSLHIFFAHRRRQKRNSLKEEAKKRILREGDIDFSNVINSSFKAKALYDVLKKQCHPDRFAKDEELTAKATEIFSLLVKHKHDYAALCALKQRAEKELHLSF